MTWVVSLRDQSGQEHCVYTRAQTTIMPHAAIMPRQLRDQPSTMRRNALNCQPPSPASTCTFTHHQEVPPVHYTCTLHAVVTPVDCPETPSLPGPLCPTSSQGRLLVVSTLVIIRRDQLTNLHSAKLQQHGQAAAARPSRRDWPTLAASRIIPQPLRILAHGHVCTPALAVKSHRGQNRNIGSLSWPRAKRYSVRHPLTTLTQPSHCPQGLPRIMKALAGQARYGASI